MTIDQDTGAADAAPDQEPGAVEVAPEIDWNDPDAVAQVYDAGEGAAEESPAPEPADTQQMADETEVPPAAPEGPVDVVPPTEHTFQPFEIELDGQKFKVESEDKLREAFRLQKEFGKQTRKHASERENWEKGSRERDEELQLLRKLKEDVGPILDGLKRKPDLATYLQEELELDKVVDPREIAMNERFSRIEQFQQREAEVKQRNTTISILDSTRREHFGYETPISQEEIARVERYAEMNGVSREELYGKPLIAAGVYAVLVGMGYIPPPQVPADPGAPGKSVKEKVADAGNLPPASSGAPPTPRPYSHKGKDPDDVLRDLAEIPESGVDKDVLRLMGVEPRK